MLTTYIGKSAVHTQAHHQQGYTQHCYAYNVKNNNKCLYKLSAFVVVPQLSIQACCRLLRAQLTQLW